MTDFLSDYMRYKKMTDETFLEDYLRICKKHKRYLVTGISGTYYIAVLDEELLGYQVNDIRRNMDIIKKI